MNLKIAKKEEEFEKINDFFWKMWKQEFDLDKFNEIEEYKKGYVIFIEGKNKIIWAIYFLENNKIYKIWRFWVLKDFRGQSLGKKLFLEMEDFLKKKKIKKLQVYAEIKNISMYEKFWFKKIWELQKVWNTEAVMMEKNY